MNLILKELWLFISTCLVAPWRTTLRGLPLFILIQNSPSTDTATLRGAFVKTFKDIYISLCWLGQGIRVGANTSEPESSGGKAWGMRYLGNKGFEKLPYIPGNLKASLMPKVEYMLRKDLRRLYIPSCLSKFEVLLKQIGKAKVEL